MIQALMVVVGVVDPTSTTTTVSGSSVLILAVGAIGGVGGLIGALLTFFRGKRTDKYGIYSQAFKDLTTDIERVRGEAQQDRDAARARIGSLTDEKAQLQRRVADLEVQVSDQKLTAVTAQKLIDTYIGQIVTLETEIAALRQQLRTVHADKRGAGGDGATQTEQG